LLNSAYGALNASYLAQEVAPKTQTGDTLLVTYEFQSMMVYIAWSQSNTQAWLRPLLALNMTELFNFVV